MIGGSASQNPLEVSNGTTVPITVVVDGEVVAVVAPLTTASIPASELPPLPWTISARTPSGRELGTMGLAAGDVAQTTGPDGQSSMRGAGLRVDLSCGRLDIWVGPPMVGPMPGPGNPGDCGP
jgi:hypothetical protein